MIPLLENERNERLERFMYGIGISPYNPFLARFKILSSPQSESEIGNRPWKRLVPRSRVDRLGNLEKFRLRSPENELLRRSRMRKWEHDSMVEGNGPEKEFECAFSCSKRVMFLKTSGNGPENRFPNKSNDSRLESLLRFVVI